MSEDHRHIPVDETSLSSRTIDVLSPSIAGFVGPALSGPVAHAHALTSLEEFAHIYGQPVSSGDRATIPDFLRHAVRAFFAEGGTRAYVVRTRSTAAPAAPDIYEEALQALTTVAEVSIVAAPGSTYVPAGAVRDPTSANAVEDLLIRHAEQMRYRIAVLDSANGLDVVGVRAQRARINSSCAAFYYPWLHAIDPLTGGDILLPPSGFVAGIYARVDSQRGAWSAPANEVVRLAVGLEHRVDAAQGDALNASGVNTLRVFTDRGVVLWGARTASDASDWKYVNVRRYAAFLERSIEQGLQWAVFEPNAEALWSTVRQTVENFLSTEWRRGALMGTTPEQAYTVRCDRTTMTQQDLDEGRLTCVVGVALVRPAEFVIFQIGLWTASHRP